MSKFDKVRKDIKKSKKKIHYNYIFLIIFSVIITTLYINDKITNYINENTKLENIVNEYKYKELTLSEKLLSEIKENKGYEEYFNSLPYGKPLDTNIINSKYGWRTHPIDSVVSLHTGIDFKASIGTNIYATGNGKILYAGYKNGYGKCIFIQHKLDHISIYAHLYKIYVKVNDNVLKGDIIALSGNTGMVSGPHLHYEIRIGNNPINPQTYVFNNY
jgi:murein DD-endopeptidase MepM/ murein hydrolase activator NlpD